MGLIFGDKTNMVMLDIDHIELAGQFNEIEAFRIVQSDLDKMTLMLEVEKVKKLLETEG